MLTHYMGDPKDYEDAYNQLLKIEPDIASVSLSLIHGETSAYVPSPSIASEVLLSAKIPSAPHEKVKDEYAEKLLLYKDIVELDYTTNYIANDFLLDIIRDNSGTFFVHYLIEPKRLSIEQDIVIPKPSQLQMSSLILANRVQKDPKEKGQNKAFQIRGVQFVPSPRNDFSGEDTLHLVFQVNSLDEELRENGFLEYSISKQNIADSEKVLSYTKAIREYADQTSFYEEFSLKNLPADYYKIKAALLNRNKEEVLARENNFYISPFASIPRPWVLSLSKPPSDSPVYLHILGNQLLSRKDIPGARALLEKDYRQDPDSSEFALDLCRALFAAKDYKGVKNVALPFYQSRGKNEFLGLLGQSCQALREYEEAISYYKAHLSHFGTNINILNSIGECYYQLGNIEEALIAWEKSLELNPQQEKLKKTVDSLKQKK